MTSCQHFEFKHQIKQVLWQWQQHSLNVYSSRLYFPPVPHGPSPPWGPSPVGVCGEQPAVGAGSGAWAEPGEGGSVRGGGDEAHGEWRWRKWGRGQAEELVRAGGGRSRWGQGGVGGAPGVPGVLPAGGGAGWLGAEGAEWLCPLSERGHRPLSLCLSANLNPLPVHQPAAHAKSRPLKPKYKISRRHRHVRTDTLTDAC